MPTSAFYSYCLLGHYIHFIHHDRNRLDHKPINSVLQLVGVQQVDFTGRPSVIHVWQTDCHFPMDPETWREMSEYILVQCLLCRPLRSSENIETCTRWTACWEALIAKNMMYIYNFMAFKVLNKILFMQNKTFVCFFFVTPHSRIFSPFIYTESGMEEER